MAERDKSVLSTIKPEQVITVEGTGKSPLFDALGEAAARILPENDPPEIVRRLWERESLLSTRLGEHIAMPHAQVPGATGSHVIVALCPNGIEYDVHMDELVHLVLCVVGSPVTHLGVLSQIATTLQSEGVLDDLVEAARAGDAERAIEIFSSDRAGARRSPYAAAPHKAIRSQQIWLQALRLAPIVGAKCILLHATSAESRTYQVPDQFEGEVFVLTPEELGMPPHPGALNPPGAPRADLTISLLYALAEQRIKQDDVIINVYGSHEPSVLDTIRVTDVEAAFRLFFSVSRELSLEPSVQRVMLRVVELAAELAGEGREGKPVGALFVVGDTPSVTPHCQQMLMNPFKGYDASQRNILDPGLTETVKELSRIDGAFVISDSGVIESAGTYLRVDVDLPELPSGLGARHTAAAAITAVTGAVAIAISESTRQVSIFRHGRRVVVL